jgi:hypothetical protein
MPIGQPTWRARDQPLRDPGSRWSMPGDDRGGRHGRCLTSPCPAEPTGSTGPPIRPLGCWTWPRTTPGCWARPACAGPGRWARRSGTAGPQPDHAGALAGPARLPLCPGGRRLAGPDRQPPLGAAGRGQRRGPAPGRRPRPAGCRRPWRCWSPGTASGRPPGCPGFASAEGWAALAERRAAAHASVRLAHGAGVLVGAGTDFGGGWLRPNQLPWEVETLVAAGLEPYDALAAATINGGRLLGEPGAGVLAQGPGRHLARPRRPPDRPGIAVAGVAHQLVPPHP